MHSLQTLPLKGIFIRGWEGSQPSNSFALEKGVTWLTTFPTSNKWRRQWHPTPVLLPGKSHGWKGLVGCGPWHR